MAANETLHKARKSQNDEFYTQLADIENEIYRYKEQFKDKIVFCNCDDPYESMFFKYFAMNFSFLELKKLIATCYIGSPLANTQLSLFDHEPVEDKTTKAPHKIEIVEVNDYNEDGAVDLADVEYLLRNKKNVLTRLQGDGDFRSAECIRLLKEADIVVTNPPFSLFREYVEQLMEYEKKFIIIGSQNAITYKEIFKLIEDNKLWMGYGFNGGNAYFRIVNEASYAEGVYNKETQLVKFRNVRWFTNLDNTKRHEKLLLYLEYHKNSDKYQKYDNYDAINVNKTADIPCDYEGVMGVPITFLDKYNPEQFEVLGLDRYMKDNPKYGHRFCIKNKETYARILIKNKNPQKG